MATESFQSQIRNRLTAGLKNPHANEIDQLNNALRLLSKWRSVLIQNTLLRLHGTTVMQGPFAGMQFLSKSAEGCHIAKLVGCYEQPLHPHIEQAIATGYQTLVNIGCAEGFYTVGLARRMPGVRVLAFDIDETAQDTCRELAEVNGVLDRVTIGARFDHAGFAALPQDRTLIICDIEGGEGDLLDPALAPALAGFDLIVESHDCIAPGMTERLQERFAATHEIVLVRDDGQRQLETMPDWFLDLSHLDQLLASWEWRAGPTPWLVMKSRAPVSG